ncbi:hypothetical protein B5X24_HaOG202061, partial [Helicoverpa armigera]
ERNTALRDYRNNDRLARIYHAYDVVHRCVNEPFSLSQPEALLNAARYILALIDTEPPSGVSMFCIYLCLSKQAKVLNANTLARQMLDKILGLQIPHKFQESVELLILKTRASTGVESRDDEVAPLCWRCRRHAPPLCASRCPYCRHALAHSLATHEVLPLVQFEPAEGVVVCSRGALLQLSPASVVVIQRPPLSPLLYRNMLPELPATACQHCHNLFYLEDFEIQVVTKGHCPFCRHPAEQPRGDEEETEDSLLNDSSLTPTSPSNDRSSW